MSNHVTIIKFYNNETLKHFIFYFHIKNSNKILKRKLLVIHVQHDKMQKNSHAKYTWHDSVMCEIIK